MRRLFLTAALITSLATFATPTFAAATLALDEIAPSALIERVEQMKLKAKNLQRQSEQRDFISDAESLSTRLAKIEDFNSLSAKQRNRIANDYESLRARADGGEAKSSRRICERVRRTGTNMVKTICLTQAEREQIAAKSADSMTELQRKTPDYAQ